MIRNGLFIVLSLLSFGTMTSWIASYTFVNKSFEPYGLEEYGFTVEKPFRGGNVGVVVSNGTASFLLTTILKPGDAEPEVSHHFLGFAYMTFPQTFQPEGRYLVRSIDLPLWFLLGLFLTYPAVAFFRGPYRRYRRRRRELCVNCGYNLTGNVSGVCPECGKPI